MIAIVDYHMGNLFSVEKKLLRLGASVKTSSDPAEIRRASHIVLPGVGHFGKAMDALHQLDLIGPLQEAVQERKIPVLGICLGMQLMTDGSEEGGVEGLGWFDCSTERIRVSDPYRFKIPHTGWNTIEHTGNDPILTNVPSGSEVYFVHAFGVLSAPETEILTTTTYEKSFVSGLKKENMIGMQFHPEKSHDTGLQLFKNFLALRSSNS